MCNAVLITIGKMCQQPKSPSKDKETVLYPHRILFSHKKEGSTDTFYNLHEP